MFVGGREGASKSEYKQNCFQSKELLLNHRSEGTLSEHPTMLRVSGSSGKNGEKALPQPPACPNCADVK